MYRRRDSAWVAPERILGHNDLWAWLIALIAVVS